MTEHVSSASTESGSNQSSGIGLPRWMGWIGVLTFSLAGLGLSRASNLILEIVPGRWPGIDLTVVVAVALAAGLMFTLTFASMGALIRRPAADYVLSSRVIHPSLGFASSWTFLITISLFAGNVAGSIARQTLPNLFQTLGTVFGSQEFLPLAGTTAAGQVAVMVGTVVIIISFLVMTLSPKTTAWLLWAGFILMLLSWIALIFLLTSSQGSTFTARYDQVFGSGTYAQHIEQAYQYGLDTGRPTLRSILLVGLLSSFYLFFGAALPTLVSGEVKKPSKTLVTGSTTALLLAGGMTLVSVLLLQQVVPIQFLSAQSYLTQKEIEVTGLALSWLPFYAAVVRPLLPLVGLIGISWIYLLFLLVMVLMFSASRIVLAWARDHILPERLGYIHPRQKTPLFAVFIAAAAVQIGLIDAVQGGTVFSSMHFAVFLSSSQVIPVASLLLFPIIGKKVAGITHPSKLGLLLGTPIWLATLGFLVWSIAAVLIYPFQLQGIRPATFTWLAVCFLSGFAWYWIRWFYLRRKGADLNEVFRSVPPEA